MESKSNKNINQFFLLLFNFNIHFCRVNLRYRFIYKSVYLFNQKTNTTERLLLSIDLFLGLNSDGKPNLHGDKLIIYIILSVIYIYSI